MSNHAQAIVPISTWCYCSPELGYKGFTLDIGVMAEALIYYETIFVNITDRTQFATFIDWFVKQGQYDKFLSLVSDGVIQFYDYSFTTSAVSKDNITSIWNIVDPIQEKPNSFEQRFLYHSSIESVLSTGGQRKKLYSTLRGKVIEVKSTEFKAALQNARSDHKEPRRNAVILQAFVDELYRFRNLGHPPQVESKVRPSDGLDKIQWNISFDELTKLAGRELHFHEQTPFTAGAISNRLLWSAANLNCDLYLSKPMSVMVGDKLYESSFRALKTSSAIDTLQRTVEFPNVRNLVNEAKLNLDDILLIRGKAGKFRKWLQSEGERDRDALIAYHNEVAKDSGFTKTNRAMLNLFGILGGAAIGGIVEHKVPGIPGAAIGAVAAAGTEYLFDIAKRMNQDWKPIIFGDWVKNRIETLLDDLKDKEGF